MTFLVNMFRRLDKFNFIRGGHIHGGAYIQNVNWVAYLRDVYLGVY